AMKSRQLILSVAHSAQRRAHLHGHPVAFQRFGVEGGILQRETRSGYGQLTVSVEPLDAASIHVLRGVEVVDLCGDAAPEWRRVESIAGMYRPFPALQSLPERVRTGTNRRDAADAGNHHASLPPLVDVRLIDTTGGCTGGDHTAFSGWVGCSTCRFMPSS